MNRQSLRRNYKPLGRVIRLTPITLEEYVCQRVQDKINKLKLDCLARVVKQSKKCKL